VTSSPSVGSLIASRYELLSRLGQGGMGMVFKARDRMLGETVAVKVLRPEALDSPEMAARFRAEIVLARSVSHRNVCRIHEYGEDGGLCFISMAFVDGDDLKSLIRRGGPLSPVRTFEVASQVADGLQAIHDEGIVHRDLKTSNLMVDRRGIVRVMDFGIAKQWEGGGAGSLTAAGQIVGTPEYMSPEQIRGRRLDPRSDLYSLGIVVHEMLTGRTPFACATPIATLMRHLQEELHVEDAAAAGLPEAVVPILRRALAKEPADRFESARAMAEALRWAQRTSATPHAPEATLTAHGSLDASASGGAGASIEGHTPTARPVPATGVPAPTAAPRLTRERTSSPATAALETRARPRPRSRARWALLGALVGLALVVAIASRLHTREAPRQPDAGRRAEPAVAEARLKVAPQASSEEAVDAPEPPVTATGPVVRTTPAPRVRAAMDLPRSVASPSAPLISVPEGAVAESLPSVESLLRLAEAAIDEGKYGLALDQYGEVLKRDPDQAQALEGHRICAEALAASAGGRAFVSGPSVVLGAVVAPPGPRGFEEGGGVAPRRLEEATPPSVLIEFQAEPRSPRPGETFTIKVFVVNEGGGSERISSLGMTTIVNGGRAAGTVPPLVSEAPPRSRTLVYRLSDMWKSSTATWSLTVDLRTARGETVRSTTEWR
jgi:serine/threonine protein kinase